jgi:nicotinamide-nucleotide amidase
MGLYPTDIEAKAATIVATYRALGWMIATAESCTGGLIAGALTEIAGSSAVVDRGFVTYTNKAKMDLIGVSAKTLESFGAVSKETALQMAHGALMRSDADVAVAVTGIAGPGGGSNWSDRPSGDALRRPRPRAGAAGDGQNGA